MDYRFTGHAFARMTARAISPNEVIQAMKMMCSICKTGQMKEGFTQVVLSRGESTIVFKNVPAFVCDDCGEYVLDENTASEIYSQAEKFFALSQEVTIVKYKVA